MQYTRITMCAVQQGWYDTVRMSKPIWCILFYKINGVIYCHLDRVGSRCRWIKVTELIPKQPLSLSEAPTWLGYMWFHANFWPYASSLFTELDTWCSITPNKAFTTTHANTRFSFQILYLIPSRLVLSWMLPSCDKYYFSNSSRCRWYPVIMVRH